MGLELPLTRNGRPARHIVLMGMMGSGKTTVGDKLVNRLRIPLLDNDDMLLTATGHTARQLQEQKGTEYLHQAEAAALKQALTAAENTIIAAAGSTIANAECRELMREVAYVVWLTAPVDTLTARAQTGEHRPYRGDNFPARMRRLFEERKPLFTAAADLTVDVRRLPPDKAADKIVESLRGRRVEEIT